MSKSMGIAERREREFRQREQSILQAALGLVGSTPWAEITIDRIAEQAEIGKGTVYKHFRSKEEILAKLRVGCSLELLEKLKQVDPALGPIPRLKESIKIHLRTIYEDSRQFSLWQQCTGIDPQSLSPELAAEFVGSEEAIYGHFSGLLEEGRRLGLVSGEQPDLQIFAGHAAMVGSLILLQIPRNKSLPLEEVLEYLADFITRRLEPGPPP
ncbi:MAG: TetR/AcrR family transcriptional regulator [Deltaproteobacteria bacterium]|nr:TetR/AcrR family transcriptional regulator [Deltaproteobacteria bacterium]